MKRDITDALFSKYVRLLDEGYCKRCKKYLGVNSQGLHCAHFHTRGKKNTRWDRDNATSLCYGCHRYLDQHHSEKTEFFMNLLGTKRFNELYERAKVLRPQIDIKALRKDLRTKIKILEDSK